MSPLNSLIFGLGLFFLGLRLVGENLRRLSGAGFRSLIKRGTRTMTGGALLGLAAGAVMQSATAVTFVLVSMTQTGLIKVRAAAPVVVWANVGLTSLAFVATFDIHPVVAFVVGGAGIVLGTVRIPLWQAVAGALIGLGLILIGLEQMGTGAAPLKDAAWFREALDAALFSAPLTFLAGVAAAAILQSNTGAAMLVITFASGGLLTLSQSMLLLYGTNLGAIGLRWFLASGLRGEQLRLVRLEDFFCVVSAVVMLALYGAERWGFPGVETWVGALPVSTATRLALVFLLSNLFPAVLLSLFPARAAAVVARWVPDRPEDDDPGRPKFLKSHALDDPSTAVDLIQRELARLLATVRVPSAPSPTDADAAPADFARLALAIEEFAARLAARNALDGRQAARLHLRRAELSIIRHIEESVRYFATAFFRQRGPEVLREKLNEILGLAARAAADGETVPVGELYRRTRLKGEELSEFQRQVASESLAATALFEDFSLAVWSIHRLAKMLQRVADVEQGAGSAGTNV